MTVHTSAPAGTNLRPRIERNARGRDLIVAGVHGNFVTPRRPLAELEVNELDRVFSLGKAARAMRDITRADRTRDPVATRGRRPDLSRSPMGTVFGATVGMGPENCD